MWGGGGGMLRRVRISRRLSIGHSRSHGCSVAIGIHRTSHSVALKWEVVWSRREGDSPQLLGAWLAGHLDPGGGTRWGVALNELPPPAWSPWPHHPCYCHCCRVWLVMVVGVHVGTHVHLEATQITWRSSFHYKQVTTNLQKRY